MTGELKPCPNPWCPTDSRRVIVWDLYSKMVICTCGVKGPRSDTRADTNEHSIPINNERQEQATTEAIAAWNTRTPTPAAPQEGARMPDTIWADSDGWTDDGGTPWSEEYTRKDLSDARIAELEAELAEFYMPILKTPEVGG